MLKKLLPIALLLTCHTFATHAAKPDENVVITSGIEEYRFVQGKNGPEIKHSTTTGISGHTTLRAHQASHIPQQHHLPRQSLRRKSAIPQRQLSDRIS